MLELTVCPDPECGAVAEVADRFILPSTDGPVELRLTHCINLHTYRAPAPTHQPGSAWDDPAEQRASA